MAVNPQFPPHDPRDEQNEMQRKPAPEVVYGHQFPWGIIAAIITIICLGVIAWYFLR